MKLSNLSKSAIFSLFITFSSLASPIGIASGSADLSTMVTKMVFVGEPLVNFYDYDIYGLLYGSISQNIKGEGFYYDLSNGAKGYVDVSENAFSYYTQTIGSRYAMASMHMDVYRRLDVTNLKELSIEFDCNASLYLETDLPNSEIHGFISSYAELYTPNLPTHFPYITYDQYFEGISEELVSVGQSLNITFQKPVSLQHTFDSPYSGTLFYRWSFGSGTYIVSDSISVPESPAIYMILLSLVSVSGLAFRRKRLIGITRFQ